ncbi:MAG TPA: hypothetical protein VGF67_24640 [Ktedonobacteraceae bacterium]|jgi:hypothetical protein
MQALGQEQTTREKAAYSLQDTNLPFLLRKAQRRNIRQLPTIVDAATQSDGATSGQDGKDDDQEEFDWLKDD